MFLSSIILSQTWSPAGHMRCLLSPVSGVTCVKSLELCNHRSGSCSGIITCISVTNVSGVVCVKTPSDVLDPLWETCPDCVKFDHMYRVVGVSLLTQMLVYSHDC